MKIPPELRLDALKVKDECQARIREELAGLSPEERKRKEREMLEKGPMGDLWRRLRSRSSTERKAEPSAAEST